MGSLYSVFADSASVHFRVNVEGPNSNFNLQLNVETGESGDHCVLMRISRCVLLLHATSHSTTRHCKRHFVSVNGCARGSPDMTTRDVF